MKFNCLFYSFVTVVMVVAVTAPALAGDSPWPMFRHDLRHQGRTPFTGPALPVTETFAPWRAGPDTGVVYTISVAVLLGSDDNRYNDTLATQARAIGELVSVPKGEPQAQFSLGPCFPNPFKATTLIRFSIRERSRVSLKIYNVAGQLVRRLFDRDLSPGTYTDVMWDGRDDSGNSIGPGVYLYKLDTPLYSETKKMVLLR